MATAETALTLITTEGELQSPDSPFQIARRALKAEMVQNLQASRLITQITDGDSYQSVVDAGRVMQAGQNKAAEFFKPIKQSYDRAKQVVLEAEKADVGEIETEKRRLAALIQGWDAKEAKRLREESIRHEEQARKDEIERRLAEAMHIESQGASKEAVDEKLAEESMPIAIVQPHLTPAKVSGKTSRELWCAQVDNLKELVKAVAEGKVPLEALEANQSFLNKMASAFRSGLSYPGVKAYPKTTTSFREK